MRNKLIPSVMDKTRLEVMKILQASTSLTIILDIWSSKKMFGFIGFTCMCVNKEFERRMVFLGVKKMTERHTAEIFWPNTTRSSVIGIFLVQW
jgi:hypothetical protein